MDQIKLVRDKRDSVNAPDAIVNWHSHPISCYSNEKTIWGGLLVKMMRESIIYGFRGSACHVVPAVEGTYTIQPNPCFITSLLNIENIVITDYPKFNIVIHKINGVDFLRGFIILAIEIYFRCTHVFRTMDYMQNYADVTAEDFVDFTNVFQLKNIFQEKEFLVVAKLNVIKLSRFENKKAEQIPFEKYVKDYEDDTTNIYIS